MIDIALLKTQLETAGYPVQYSRSKEPVLQELTDLPIIYLGYSTIDSKHPSSPIEYSLLNQHGEDLVQSFSIQIVCEQTMLSTIWKTIHPVLIGWNPNPNEAYRSGLTYSQGGVVGIENSRIWWVDIWRLGFPTVNVNF